MHPLRDSSGALADAGELRDRLADDGYLFLPGVLDAAEIGAVLAELRTALHGAGWLTDPQGLVAEPGPGFRAESFGTVYPAVLRLESVHRLAFTPVLWGLVEHLFGEEVFCHPARVVRLARPSARPGEYATRAHQDFVVQHVSTDALTAWIPFTGCDPGRQGLRLIPGSHREGLLPTDAALGGRRPLYLPVAPQDPRWATADYAPGDLVLFHSLTVHGGGPNDSGELRLSADVRYQPLDEPLRAEFAHPHGWPLTPDWDELAADWSTDAWYRLDDRVRLLPMPPASTTARTSPG
ncbi:phytanoyl-CoA dioxygenase family protein [Streptacidiphilus sp. PB12-B1b]|uniref:phytanoyl-CoA dioxygenase family protein n=1 Tax=Streptacidiphilus sp. PB12-B1b TaxID=2705012 RepID=UPI001CDD44AC|nr:phytanoyl-CoA dioxygenase family protein [Streptacidiphilus sp. PB12-B1b]